MSGPQTTKASLTVAENATATTIGIVAPTDSGFSASQLTVFVTGLPTDGNVFLADGVTPVTNGETLTVAQLTGLKFAPTSNVASQSSKLTYGVSDPNGAVAAGYATLGISAPATDSLTVNVQTFGHTVKFNLLVNGVKVGNTQTVTTAGTTSQNVTVTGNFSGASTIDIQEIAGQSGLYVNSMTLDGTNYFSRDGELNTGNGFLPGSGYTALGFEGTLRFIVGNGILTTTPVATEVSAGNAPSSIGIVDPVDANYTKASLTAIVTGLPTNGTVYLADGVTPVFVGETLSEAQLAGLKFAGNGGAAGQISELTYTVTDPTGAGDNVGPGPKGGPGPTGGVSFPGVAGVATLSVVANANGPQTTPASLTVNQNASATSIGIAAPTGSGTLSVSVLGLPTDGTVTLSNGTAINAGDTLTVAQLTGLKFTPTAGAAAFSSEFSYSVTDSSANSSLGTAILSIAPVSGTILTVGPGKQFTTIAAAVAASHSGDTIQVAAGTYVNDYASITTNITLEGVGGMVNMISTQDIPNGKGIFIINGNVTINNFTFSGATVDPADANGAGVRYESGNLILNDDYFFNNQNGLLGGANATGTITVNNCEFADNGIGDSQSLGYGFTHNIYVGGIATLTINNSYFHNANIGNEIKSRAANTTITNSRIDDNPTGTSSYSIDIPDGGNVTIQNNVIQQGPLSENPIIISIGEESNNNTTTNIQITGNTILNDLTFQSPLAVRNLTPATAQITNNTFVGLTSGQIATGPNSMSGNTIVSSEPGLITTEPWAEISTPCFLRGTLILTEAGEKPVEKLAIGDKVMTLSGDAKPIYWIGRRAYNGRFVRGNREVLPICVAAGALADGTPARDLFLSPHHAFFIDGVLVPAWHLVNGANIVQLEEVEHVEYFHIELEAHDIILAEGAPAETYLNCNNRSMFQNVGEFVQLYPEDRRQRGQDFAPRLEDGSATVRAVHAALLKRASALGYQFTDDPDPHLVVDGEIVRPRSAENGLHRFAIPAGSRAVWLASRCTVPAEVDAGSQDRRPLGVSLDRIVLHDNTICITIKHDFAGLCDGFHPDEGCHRWTEGMARLPEELLHPFTGDFTIDLHLIPNDLSYCVQKPRLAVARVARSLPRPQANA